MTQNGTGAGRSGRKQRKIRRANGSKKHKSEPKQLRFALETTYGPEGRGFESLTRQFPDGEEEYVQVRVDAHYPDREGSIQLQDTMWSDWMDDKAQFFDYVRRSAAYTALVDTLPMAVDITCDQT